MEKKKKVSVLTCNYGLSKEVEYFIPCFSGFVFWDKLWEEPYLELLKICRLSQQVLDKHLVWQKEMAEILLLFPKLENIWMYYRTGEREKNHTKVIFHYL